MSPDLPDAPLPAVPFEVKDCALITLALGKSALNLRELRDRVAEVPPQSLYHHFYETLLRPSFDDPEYRNDFALWSRRQLSGWRWWTLLTTRTWKRSGIT